jgi:hypothetical protein
MRSLLALVVLLASTALALAEPMEIRPKAPVATFDLPDSWETSRIERGIQTISPDKEVDLWIEAYRAGSIPGHPGRAQRLLETAGRRDHRP